MKYYWSDNCNRWLNEDEQSRFHLDYEPHDSEWMARWKAQKSEIHRRIKRILCEAALKRWKKIAQNKSVM